MYVIRRCLLIPVLLLWAALASAQERIRDVIYMKSNGAAFTMDVFKPKEPNGAAVIYLVSGGWFSSHEGISNELASGMNSLGYTVFQVVHGAQPRYKIADIAAMITRAVRFIHANAATYGVDDKRMALMGGSAGGHLTLITAARGDAGDPNAKDPVDRAPSTVTTAIAFFPPTDFLHYGPDSVEVNRQNPLMTPFIPAFGIPDNATPAQVTELLKALSPITYVTAQMPPTLLIHGDEDPLVPIQQSHIFMDRLKELGVKSELVTVKGGKHDGVTVAGGQMRIITWLAEFLKKP